MGVVTLNKNANKYRLLITLITVIAVIAVITLIPRKDILFMTEALKYLLYGWIILIAAIIINFLAGVFKIKTWYGFLSLLTETDLKTAMSNLSVIEALFLFIIYPGLFGFIIYLIAKN